MSAIDIFDKAVRELYRGDGGRLSSYDEGWNDGVEAALSSLYSPPSAISEEMVRVPREPTEAMLDAICNMGFKSGSEAYREIYKTMIAAAQEGK